MTSGNVRDFLDSFTYQSAALIFRGRKYFTDGVVFDNSSGKYEFSVDQWNGNNEIVKRIFSGEGASVSECLEAFENARIWDGMTIYEAEKEMTWVDW